MTIKRLTQGLICTGLLTAATTSMAQNPVDDTVQLAINYGGPAHHSADGIAYQADAEKSGVAGTISDIRGAQDPTIFQTYRSGELNLSYPLQNGEYTVTLNFTEPDKVEIGDRVFNVLVEDEVVIPNFDIYQARGTTSNMAVVWSIPAVKVTDGQLDIQLDAINGEPVINAVAVRTTPAKRDDWQLVWQDAFDYEGAPDPSKWTHDIWPAGKVNQEDQAYTDRLKNVRVEDGMLVIEAHKEKYDNAEYTSGRIHSAGKGDLLYGRVDVRAKLPFGQGTWPAIWMLSTNPFKYATNCKTAAEWQGNNKCDAWPNSGEIDIMEHVGYDMNRVHGTVHTKAYYWVIGKQRQATIEADNVNTQFHLYSLEWSPTRIDILYDNQPYFTYLNPNEGWEGWPFDHPFHVILNIAMGGGWGGSGGPTDDSILPARMLVDYVRLYQLPEHQTEPAN